MIKRLLISAALVLAATGCTSQADKASKNLSKAAEEFEVVRRVIFYNTFTDTYISVIEGRCSVEMLSSFSEVTCKVGPNEFKKDYLRKSDNTTMIVQQLETVDVSVYHHRVLIKPQNILPALDFASSFTDVSE